MLQGLSCLGPEVTSVLILAVTWHKGSLQKCHWWEMIAMDETTQLCMFPTWNTVCPLDEFRSSFHFHFTQDTWKMWSWCCKAPKLSCTILFLETVHIFREDKKSKDILSFNMPLPFWIETAFQIWTVSLLDVYTCVSPWPARAKLLFYL